MKCSRQKDEKLAVFQKSHQRPLMKSIPLDSQIYFIRLRQNTLSRFGGTAGSFTS
jgi:hypothetical protein